MADTTATAAAQDASAAVKAAVADADAVDATEPAQEDAAADGAEDAAAKTDDVKTDDVKTDDAKTDEPSAKALNDIMRALTNKVTTLEASLAETIARADNAERALADFRATSEKETILRGVGIDTKYATFLTGDADTWKAQADALAALRGTTPAAPSVPRDPAVDSTNDQTVTREELVLEFLGLADSRNKE